MEKTIEEMRQTVASLRALAYDIERSLSDPDYFDATQLFGNCAETAEQLSELSAYFYEMEME